jgi:hypothetical protein
MNIDSIPGTTGKQVSRQKENRAEGSDFSAILDTKKRDIRNDKMEGSSSPGIGTSAGNQKTGSILLGEISRSHPTVSHLLIDHPDYQKTCWKIIHSEQNQNKPFRKITEGTKIYIDQTDGNLFWNRDMERKTEKEGIDPDLHSTVQRAAVIHPAIHPVTYPMDGIYKESDSLSEKLVDAVKQNLGMKYDQVNCYELIVQGLRQLGYRYGGHGGLKETLINMAVSKGEAINTYFSGEGLIASSGTADFVKSFEIFSDYKNKANEIMKEISTLIQPGQILSFSTPSRGHTGIISSKGDQWTYVNSGRLDNSIDASAIRRGVGEETLVSEILNWVKLAGRKKEPLVLTIGRLDENKLEPYKVIPWDA